MTDNKMSSMEALSFPEGTRFTDGLAQRLVRSGDGFFCEDCNVNHSARDLSLTFLKLADTENEFMVSGLDTRFVHRDVEGDLWIYFSEDEEGSGKAGWIFGANIEHAFSKAKNGGFAWLDMTDIEIPDEGKNLLRKDDILGFSPDDPSRAILREVEGEEVPTISQSLARIAAALEKIAEGVK